MTSTNFLILAAGASRLAAGARLPGALALTGLLALGCGGSSQQSSPFGPGFGGTGTGGGDDANKNGDTGSATTADVVFPDEAFRATQPVAGKPRPFQLPGIKQFKLAKSVDVYLVERHSLPTISISFVLEGGSINDARGKEGTASVCMSMMSEGTQKLDKIAFKEALADIGSNVRSYSGSETQGLSMSTLSKHLDTTLGLFTDVVTTPGFRQSDLDRMIKRRLESLKQAKASPGSVASRLRNNIIYGPKHTLGRISNEKSLKEIKLADCKRYHKQYIRPAGARLFIVGDMTQAQVVEKFAPLFTKWKGKPKKSRRVAKPVPRAGKIFFVDIPGAAQSSIGILHLGPKRNDPKFFDNQMMAQVLGGGFSSRINMNLREDKGYSYGARGRFAYTRNYGYFSAGSSVRSDATYQSVLEIFKEINGLLGGKVPATKEELSREKNGAILGLPARFATANQTLSQYRNLVYYGLPLDYYNSYIENISSVDLDAVMAAAKKQLKPNQAKILIVGDAKAKMIMRGDDGKDVPLTDEDGNQLTLLDAIGKMIASGDVGKGKIVILDADGKVAKKAKPVKAKAAKPKK